MKLFLQLLLFVVMFFGIKVSVYALPVQVSYDVSGSASTGYLYGFTLTNETTIPTELYYLTVDMDGEFISSSENWKQWRRNNYYSDGEPVFYGDPTQYFSELDKTYNFTFVSINRLTTPYPTIGQGESLSGLILYSSRLIVDNLKFVTSANTQTPYTVGDETIGSGTTNPGWVGIAIMDSYTEQDIVLPTPVPEPSPLLLLGSGLVGLIGIKGTRLFSALST